MNPAAEGGIDRDAALFYLYCIEGDDAALVDLLTRFVETKSPYTDILQLPLLDHMGWAVTEKLKSNEAYRELISSLNFPKTRWSLGSR